MCYDLLDTKEFDNRLIELRRDFHKYPEPGWLEYRTTVRIIEILTNLGVPVLWGKDIHASSAMMGLPSKEKQVAAMDRAIKETGRADMISQMSEGFTGVVGVIEGTLPGPTIAIRVDIDANDLTESDDTSHRPVREGFASIHPESMHACGHDAHIAIGLGVAEILSKNKNKLRGKVKIIFQAAEEGGRGACSLVESGLFEGVDYFFGGHIGLNEAPYGTVAASTYGFLSGVKFDVTFSGKAAHAGKAPEEGRNAIAAAATAVLNLLAISRSGKGVSRVNVGTLHGGTGRNVIPDKAFMRAEVRGINKEVSDYMFDNALRVCKAAADMYQCQFSYEIVGKSENALCNMDFAKFVQKTAMSFGEISNALEASDLGAGENVTFMMNDVQRRGGKATFMLLGADIIAPHHSKFFDFNEKVIPLGARLYAKLVFDIGKASTENGVL